MNSIYMNHYVNIMNSFEEKGKEDIPTDEELLLFSESESEDEESTRDKIKKIQAATTYEELDNIKNKKSLKKSNEQYIHESFCEYYEQF